MRKVDSLLRTFKPGMADSDKIRLYINLSGGYYSVNTDSFFIYCKKGLELAKKTNRKIDIARLDVKMASMLTDTGNFPLAEKYARESLALGEELGAKTETMNGLINIGRVYDFQSDFVKASEYFYKAMTMAEEIQDHEAMSLIGTNLAAEFLNQGDFKKGGQYAERTLQEARLAHVPSDEYKALFMLGAVSSDAKDTAKAKEYYEGAIDVAAKNGLNLNKAEAITNLAMIQKDNNKMLELLLQARVIYDKFNPGIYESLDNWESLGECYIALYKAAPPSSSRTIYLQKAGEYLARMIDKCKASNNIPSLGNALSLASTVEALKGNYRLAYEYNNQFHAINDSIFSQQNKNKIASIESQRAIDLKNKEIENKGLQISNQHKKMWLLAAFIAFLIIVGALIYRQNLIRKKTNTTLLQLNSELDEANKIKAKFFGILSHDLRSPVASLINFLTLQKRKPGLLTPVQIAEREEIIKHAAESLLDTMEAMLLWSKGQMEHFKPDMTAVNVKELFIYLQRFFNEDLPIAYTFSCEEDLIVHTDENYLRTILQNLIANAIKALVQTENASITCKAWKEKSNIFLSITDNGPGIHDSQLKALYDDTVTTGSKSGLGLHIIRDLAKAIGCSIALQPQTNTGTRFVLSF